MSLTGRDFRGNIQRQSGAKVIRGSQVGVGEHGVLLPHGAETFDGVDEFLIVHKL